MMKYAPQSIKQKLQQNNINSLDQLERKKSNKYKQTLKFMTEWSNDLLQRQHDIYKSQQQLNQQLLSLQSKSKTYGSQKTQQSVRSDQTKQMDIQRIIQEELIKKIEDVYTKQILLYETCQPANQTFNTEEAPSHQQSMESQSSHQQSMQSQSSQQLSSHQSSQNSQNHHGMSQNFSNYFNQYQCNTNAKNKQLSHQSEAFSKASQLIQQQYISNQIYEEEEEQSDYSQEYQVNPKHHQTYEENFVSF